MPPGWRGTFRGLTAPAVIDHLKRLGVTTLELLPIHAFVDDRHLVERGLSNYWGYNTLGFFAPEPRYATDGALDAFRSTVSRLHDAGIEVILDVVYNHTAEGNHLGPTLSFRGIDNTSYYWLLPGSAALLRRFHRLRQRAQSHASARAADGDGFAALLGGGLPRRRLPLRSRDHARPRPERLRSAAPLLRRDPAGSGAGRRQADRRAVGHRPRRLSGRRFSARLVGMERSLPPHAAPLLGGRRQPDRRGRRPHDRRPPICSITTAAARAPASITSPCTTASRSPIS